MRKILSFTLANPQLSNYITLILNIKGKLSLRNIKRWDAKLIRQSSAETDQLLNAISSGDCLTRLLSPLEDSYHIGIEIYSTDNSVLYRSKKYKQMLINMGMVFIQT